MMKLAFVIMLTLVAAAFAQTPLAWTKILPSAAVQLRDPRSISVSPEGLLYVADTGNQRVVAVDSAGKLVAETGGLGDAHGQFRWPRVVIADRGNAVWVLDYGNRRIERFTRSLEYQGTFTITVQGSETPNQPDGMAMSPQSDLFVYDRDDSRILRYDPLFSQQAALGNGSGLQFVSAISSMAYVPALGLSWWEHGSDQIRNADALLNPSVSINLGTVPDDLRLASSESCLLYATSSGVFQRCSLTALSDTLVSSGDLAHAGVSRLTGLALTPGHVLYVLDGATASVFRVNLLRE